MQLRGLTSAPARNANNCKKSLTATNSSRLQGFHYNPFPACAKSSGYANISPKPLREPPPGSTQPIILLSDYRAYPPPTIRSPLAPLLLTSTGGNGQTTSSAKSVFRQISSHHFALPEQTWAPFFPTSHAKSACPCTREYALVDTTIFAAHLPLALQSREQCSILWAPQKPCACPFLSRLQTRK